MKKQTNVYFDGRYINADHYLKMDKDKAAEAMVKDKAVKTIEQARQALPKLEEQAKKDQEEHNAAMEKQAAKQRALKQQRSGTQVVNVPVEVREQDQQAVLRPGANEQLDVKK